jgi:hypothetical protein
LVLRTTKQALQTFAVLTVGAFTLPAISAAQQVAPDSEQSKMDASSPGNAQVLLQPHMVLPTFQYENTSSSQTDNTSVPPSDKASSASQSENKATSQSDNTSSASQSPNTHTSQSDNPSSASQSESKPPGPTTIKGSVATWDSKKISDIVEGLVDSHFETNKDAKALDKQVAHFRKPTQRAVANLKDNVNYSLENEGINPSKRMGELVLTDKAKVRDATTAEYERQHYVDSIHAQVIESLLQVATGLGLPDKTEKATAVKLGVDKLASLTGSDKAHASKQALDEWLRKHPYSALNVPKGHGWGTMEQENKVNQIVQSAFEKDSVVRELNNKVKRYAHPNKFNAAMSGVVHTTLNGVTILGSGFAIPLGAAAVLNAYVMATGGSEEGKIEKILVYEKRLQSRNDLYRREANRALDDYRYAIATNNAPLFVFSQALLVELSNPDTASRVLDSPGLKEAPTVLPEIDENKLSKGKTISQKLLKSIIK